MRAVTVALKIFAGGHDLIEEHREEDEVNNED